MLTVWCGVGIYERGSAQSHTLSRSFRSIICRTQIISMHSAMRIRFNSYSWTHHTIICWWHFRAVACRYTIFTRGLSCLIRRRKSHSNWSKKYQMLSILHRKRATGSLRHAGRGMWLSSPCHSNRKVVSSSIARNCTRIIEGMWPVWMQLTRIN